MRLAIGWKNSALGSRPGRPVRHRYLDYLRPGRGRARPALVRRDNWLPYPDRRPRHDSLRLALVLELRGPPFRQDLPRAFQWITRGHDNVISIVLEGKRDGVFVIEISADLREMTPDTPTDPAPHKSPLTAFRRFRHPAQSEETIVSPMCGYLPAPARGNWAILGSTFHRSRSGMEDGTLNLAPYAAWSLSLSPCPRGGVTSAGIIE